MGTADWIHNAAELDDSVKLEQLGQIVSVSVSVIALQLKNK